MTYARHRFTEPRIDCATFEPRYRAALNTPFEADAFMTLAEEMENVGEPLWALFYDLALGAIDRTEALADIETDFARGHASEAFKDAAYGYEVRTGRSVPDAFDLAAYDRGFGGAVTQFNRMEGM